MSGDLAAWATLIVSVALLPILLVREIRKESNEAEPPRPSPSSLRIALGITVAVLAVFPVLLGVSLNLFRDVRHLLPWWGGAAALSLVAYWLCWRSRARFVALLAPLVMGLFIVVFWIIRAMA